MSADEFTAAPAETVAWEAEAEAPRTLVELVNRVLDRGVVVGGDVTISLAGVDLVYLGLNALLTSVSTARSTLKRDVGPSRGTPLPQPPPPPGTRPPVPREAGEPVVGVGAAAAGIADADVQEALAPAPAGEAADTVQAALTEVARTLPQRLEVDPESVQRDLARLVLTLVELLRRVVEHQAVRRMDDADLSAEQVERMGLALQRLEEKLVEIRGVFGLAEEDLDVDLGPLGKLY